MQLSKTCVLVVVNAVMGPELDEVLSTDPPPGHAMTAFARASDGAV